MRDKQKFYNSFNKKRGFLLHDAKLCEYCGKCARRCPHKALFVDKTSKTWRFKFICMKCKRCVRECPQKALTIKDSIY